MPNSSIIILSGACCNPSFKSVDTQLVNRMNDAAKQLGIELVLKTVSIASIALGGLAGSFGEKVGSEIRSLLQEKGMGVLPVVIIDGNIVSYGYVPTFEKACQFLQKSTS